MFSPHFEMEWSVTNWRSSWALSVFVADNVIVELWLHFLNHPWWLTYTKWLFRPESFYSKADNEKIRILTCITILKSIFFWYFQFWFKENKLSLFRFCFWVFLAVVINRINFFLELYVLKRHTRYNKKKVDECEWRITLIWVNGSAPELPFGAGGWGGVVCIWLANKESLLWATLLLGSTECEVSSLWHRFFWKVTFWRGNLWYAVPCWSYRYL